MKASVGMATCHRMMSTQSNLDMYVEPCGIELPADFHYYPKFLNGDEQRVLLLSALRKLDDSDSPASRRRRKQKHSDTAEPQSLSHLFLPDNYYDFEEVVAFIFPFVHVQIKGFNYSRDTTMVLSHSTEKPLSQRGLIIRHWISSFSVLKDSFQQL